MRHRFDALVSTACICSIRPKMPVEVAKGGRASISSDFDAGEMGDAMDLFEGERHGSPEEISKVLNEGKPYKVS
jgi:hypothetical protein